MKLSTTRSKEFETEARLQPLALLTWNVLTNKKVLNEVYCCYEAFFAAAPAFFLFFALLREMSSGFSFNKNKSENNTK